MELLLTSVAVMSLLSVDFEGFCVINCPCIEDLPVVRLFGGVEVEGRSFPAGIRVRDHSAYMGNCWGSWESGLFSGE